MTYEEKQQRKLERFQELAKRNGQASVAAHEYSNKLADMIPFGQPILVGHHSEKSHRRHMDKIHNKMFQSIELEKKAEYYEQKANNILNSTVISSDNPDAINLLKEKLLKLEKERIEIKSRVHQSYELSNLSQNMRQVKKRIAYLISMAKVEATEEDFNGITIKINTEENRVQILFPSIPDEIVRDELKSHGFRWSPYNKAWQRQISNWAIDEAKRIVRGANGFICETCSKTISEGLNKDHECISCSGGAL